MQRPCYETERGKLLLELKAKLGFSPNDWYRGDFFWREDHWEYDPESRP